MSLSVVTANPGTLTMGTAPQQNITSVGTNPGGTQPAMGSGAGQQMQGLSFTPASTQTTSPAASTTNTANTNAVNTTAGTFGYNMNQPEYLQGIQQEYGNAIQGAKNQIAGWNGYLPTAQNDYNNVANASIAQANQTAHDTMANLGQQSANTQGQQRLSLAELADQIHGQNQGLLNQLGSVGAGFSSAALTGQQALAHAQNTQAANINSQANQNLGLINKEEDTTQHTLDTALQSVNAWKNQQLDNLLHTYSQTMSSLNSALGQAQGEEKARLAMFGQQISQQAANALGNIQNITQQAISARQGQIQAAQNAQAPSSQFQSYQAPNNISYDNTSPFTQAANTAGNATAAPTTSAVDPGLAALAAAYKNNQNQ